MLADLLVKTTLSYGFPFVFNCVLDGVLPQPFVDQTAID